MERTVWLWWPFGSHKLRTSGKGLLRPGRICEAISFYSRTDVLWYFWGWRFHSGTHAMWPMQVYLWCMYPYVIFYDTLILIFYWPNSLTYSYGFSAQSLHFVQPAINWCIEGLGQQHHRPPDSVWWLATLRDWWGLPSAASSSRWQRSGSNRGPNLD